MSANAENAASPDGGGTAVADAPLLEVRDVAKYFGSVNALQHISLKVYAGEVTCVLGDNGAGKSTLIKILSGVFQPDEGEFLIEGQPVTLAGPREARGHGIATVFQDLATVPLMSLWRNFFLGQEPTVGWGLQPPVSGFATPGVPWFAECSRPISHATGSRRSVSISR